jgi:hypothetical protein
MSSIPSMRQDVVRFREPSNSEKYNGTQADVFYDIVTLFNSANDLNTELKITNEAILTAAQFQQMKMQEIQNTLILLQQQLDVQELDSTQHVARAFTENFIVDATASAAERAYLDTFHGLLHLPITGKHISKVYIYDEVTDEIVTPSSLDVAVGPEAYLGATIEQNSILNAFNGDNYSYWHRKVIMPLESSPAAGTMYTEVIITLPDTIISNRDINMIYLHPFPLNTLTINKIEYQLDGGWNLLPGWPVDGLSALPIAYLDAGNLKFCFPTTAMSRIKITMTQPRYIEENYKKVYHFGLQEFGVFYTDYQSEIGKIDMPFNLPSKTASRLITGITPKFFNEAALSDQSVDKSKLFSYNIYTVDEQGQYQYTRDTFPILVSTDLVIVKATIHADPQNKATPTLESVELTYTDV